MPSCTRRRFTSSLLGSGLTGTALLSGCSLWPAAGSAPFATTTATATPAGAPTGPSPLDLNLAPGAWRTLALNVNGQALAVRAWEGLPTVLKPVEPAYQQINLYVPEAYFQGGTVGRYTAATAPIFLPNQVGGYMPAKPGTPEGRMGPPPAAGQAAPPSTIALALAQGYVVAAPGARGRTLRAADGRWTGKAPAAIVDLKAAVRWLRHNAGRLPGRTDRIISNGTSAGGALSALLGASGNSPEFAAELAAVGAAAQRDDIFAVSAYCPITNLDHADAAYEWQFNGVNDYRRIDISMLDFQVQRREVAGTLSADQVALSALLKAAFPAYVNGLGLHDAAGQALTLRADGQGPLLTHLQQLVMASAQQALDAGTALGDRPWLQVAGGHVRSLDWPTFVRAQGRLKLAPAFDGLALETGENQLFGDAQTDHKHFTAFSAAHGTVNGAGLADTRTVRLMNAMHFLGASDARPAPHWRVRHGTMDRDTSLAVPALLAAAARDRGLAVDLAFPWDRPHSGDYDLGELFAWIDARVATAGL